MYYLLLQRCDEVTVDMWTSGLQATRVLFIFCIFQPFWLALLFQLYFSHQHFCLHCILPSTFSHGFNSVTCFFIALCPVRRFFFFFHSPYCCFAPSLLLVFLLWCFLYLLFVLLFFTQVHKTSQIKTLDVSLTGYERQRGDCSAPLSTPALQKVGLFPVVSIQKFPVHSTVDTKSLLFSPERGQAREQISLLTPYKRAEWHILWEKIILSVRWSHFHSK